VRDIVFLATMLAFFALSVLLVRACDRLIGGDDVGAAGSQSEPHDERIAA
jgi:hypothetical protein